MAHRDRGIAWLRVKGPAVMVGTNPAAICEACGEEHLSVNYESLRMSLPIRANSRVPGCPKEAPRARNLEFSATVEAVQCDVCDSRAHVTKDCALMKQYMECGDSAYIRPQAKERCRALVRALVPAADPGTPFCKVCERQGHFTDNCGVLLEYRKHGKPAKIPGAAKQRYRK